MKKNSVLGLLMTAALAVSLSACSTTAEPTADAEEEGLLIGLVIPQADKYFEGIEEGLQAAVDADGGELIVLNSENDAAKEATNVQNLITRGVDAVIIQPANSAAGSIATMETVRDAGIALVCFGNCTDDAASPDLVGGVVQSDNTALGTGTGEVAAAYINDNLGGVANIAILNCDSFEVCLLRKAGFKDALEAAGVTANYVADQEGFLADEATPVAANMITANPEIDIFWAANDGGTVGQISAVVAAGADIKVFGTDISPQLAEALLDPNDILQATTGQDPVGTAGEAYALVKRILGGESIDPFEVAVAGLTYTRADPTLANEYLGN